MSANGSPPLRLSDDALLDLVQRQTLAFSGTWASDRRNGARVRNPVAGYDHLQTLCRGGTGFGIMALLAGAARSFLRRAAVLQRIRRIVAFLACTETYHGVFPHFLHGETGPTIPFSEMDDGGDLVEIAYLMGAALRAAIFLRPSSKRSEPS